MANYTATARSNYFRIVDRAAFDEWLETVAYQELTVLETEDPLVVGLNATNGDCSGFAMEYEDLDEQPQSLLAGLAQHLAEGEVAVLVESGSEKCRYVTGYAVAVTRDANEPGGFRMLEVSINDIYGLVEAQWGLKASEATY